MFRPFGSGVWARARCKVLRNVALYKVDKLKISKSMVVQCVYVCEKMKMTAEMKHIKHTLHG